MLEINIMIMKNKLDVIVEMDKVSFVVQILYLIINMIVSATCMAMPDTDILIVFRNYFPQPLSFLSNDSKH